MKQIAAVGILVLTLGVPLGFCVACACHRQPSKDHLPEWLPAASIEELVCDGVPQLLKVQIVHRDAWSRCAPVVVDRAYVRCTGDSKELAVLSVHGHLGCWIEFDAARRRFKSQCYSLEYDIDGKLLDRDSPRVDDMAPVDFRVDQGRLYVRTTDLFHPYDPRYREHPR